MAGPTTKTNWASYIPIIWAQRILEQLAASIVAARLVSRTFESEFKNPGDTVRLTKVGQLSAVDKVQGVDVVRQNPASTHQDLILNKHKIVPFTIEDVARAQAIPGAMDKQLAEAVRALAEQFETDILAALVAAAGGTLGTPGTDADEELLLNARKALVDARCPQGQRKVALWSTKDTNALLTTSSGKFTKASEAGRTDALYEANLGRLYGIDHFESQLVPVVAGNPATTQNLVWSPAAIEVAVAPIAPEDSGAGVKSATAVDPDSGLAVRITSQYDINAVGLATNVDVLYGIKVIRGEHVQIAQG